MIPILLLQVRIRLELKGYKLRNQDYSIGTHLLNLLSFSFNVSVQ